MFGEVSSGDATAAVAAAERSRRSSGMYIFAGLDWVVGCLAGLVWAAGLVDE